LWEFQPFNNPQKKKSITCIAWHPKYPDFFAVGYGTFLFNKQSTGALAIYSLKSIYNFLRIF
jgi:hypothetical protein